MRSDNGVPGGDTSERHVVALAARPRRRAPATVSTPDDCGKPAALALLTPDERTALNLAGSDDPVGASGPSLLAAASGLAKLAAAHLARSLALDDDMRELTRKDRLALSFAPRISADVHQAVTREEPPAGAHEPILGLLQPAAPVSDGNIVVTGRLDFGPRGTDAGEQS